MMEIHPLKSPVLKPLFNLQQAIISAIKKNKHALRDGDVLVISSKVVALSQGRMVRIASINPSARAHKLKRTHYGTGKEDPHVVELVLREADSVIPGSMLLTLKDGIFIPEAGIDLSNVPKGYAIMWPEKAWETARKLAQKLRAHFKIKKLGIVICDSHCQPLRWGVTGIALAWAGFEGIEDARGQKDIYGKPLAVTRKAVADNLASSALVVMGEAGEKKPFALIRGAPVKFTSRMQKKNEILIKPCDCIFNGIYNKKFLKMIK